jgi:hypothetical protein
MEIKIEFFLLEGGLSEEGVPVIEHGFSMS